MKAAPIIYFWEGAISEQGSVAKCSSAGTAQHFKQKEALGLLRYHIRREEGWGWEQGKSCDLLKPIVPTTANGTLYCVILYVTTV